MGVQQNDSLADGYTQASLLTFNEGAAAAPLLQVVSWRSEPGRHTWASPSWTNSLDATRLLIDFFFGPAPTTAVKTGDT